ncbi:MAG: hypothetical protein GY909_15755 [Oligoflexia bacterium]|nr:hypothetical protein [Oligoflexia bacterium]
MKKLLLVTFSLLTLGVFAQEVTQNSSTLIGASVPTHSNSLFTVSADTELVPTLNAGFDITVPDALLHAGDLDLFANSDVKSIRTKIRDVQAGTSTEEFCDEAVSVDAGDASQDAGAFVGCSILKLGDGTNDYILFEIEARFRVEIDNYTGPNAHITFSALDPGVKHFAGAVTRWMDHDPAGMESNQTDYNGEQAILIDNSAGNPTYAANLTTGFYFDFDRLSSDSVVNQGLAPYDVSDNPTDVVDGVDIQVSYHPSI